MVMQAVDEIIDFLQDKRVWWEYHNNSFLGENGFWDLHFPQEWKDPLMALNALDLLDLATFGIESRVYSTDWPLSLREFIKKCYDLPLKRSLDPNGLQFERLRLKDTMQLSRGMSPKKLHEVESLGMVAFLTIAALVNSVCQDLDIDLVLDLGAGQGYLDLALAYGYGKTVIGVDDNSVQTHGAKNRSLKALRFKRDHKIGSLYYINRRIHVSESFDSLLKELGTQVEFKNSKWLLCGLHTCGDLSPASIHHFLESDASILVNVSCCYNRLTETIPKGYKDEPNVEENPGFPMSNYLKSLNFYIGHSGRSTACQCTIRWSTDLDSLDVFDRHFYRALFQRVVIDFKLLGDIPEKDIVVGHLSQGIKKRGWIEYCKAIFRKWNIDGPSDDTLMEYLGRYKHLKIQVSIIWTIRAMLAGCLESLILLDRIMYLNEWSKWNSCPLDIQLKPIFDPIISPRNMALIVSKIEHGLATTNHDVDDSHF